jgi:hypothetical protein
LTDASPAPEQGATNEALKAEAISARRAARPAWKNAHNDRLARERQARQIAKEYRQSLRPEGKQCKDCGEVKPLDAFEMHPSGTPRATCRDCRANLKAERRREAASVAKAQREAAKEAEQAAAREAALARRRKREDYRKGIRKRPISPDRQREAAERIAHLTSLLMGTNPTERITSEQGWDMTTSELQRLWHQSGDKECVSCKVVVPPSAMLPPGPANFYPGRCRTCAAAQAREVHWIMFGKEPAAPLIPMLDGSSITVATLARRVREREQSYRSNR